MQMYKWTWMIVKPKKGCFAIYSKHAVRHICQSIKINVEEKNVLYYLTI